MNTTHSASPSAGTVAGTATYEDTLFRKIAWRLLPILMLGYLAASIDRVNVGFAKLHMAQELGFSDAVYGFGAGVFFLGYFLFEVPSSVILHKVGARLWIARIMATWGIISALTMFVSSPWQFYLVRFLLGVAEAGFIPGVIYYLTLWFPSQRRGRIMGVFYIALALAGFIGGPVSGLILQTMQGVGGLAAWKWLFIIEAIPTVLIAVLVVTKLDNNVQSAKWLSPEERQHVKTLIDAESKQKSHMPLRVLFGNRLVQVMSLIFFCDIFAMYGLGFWMPTLINNMGVKSDLSIGLMSALPSLFAVISMILVSRHSDRTGERRLHLMLLYALGAVGLSLSIVWQHNPTLGIFALCIANMGILAIPALFWNLPTAILGGAAAAAGIALINSFANLAGFLGPYLVGYAKQLSGNTESAVWLMVIVLVVGGLLILTVPAERVNKAPALSGEK